MLVNHEIRVVSHLNNEQVNTKTQVKLMHKRNDDKDTQTGGKFSIIHEQNTDRNAQPLKKLHHNDVLRRLNVSAKKQIMI